MRAFVIGVSGAVGGLLARNLTERADEVSGLARREKQRADLRGVRAHVGDLAIRPQILELSQGPTPIAAAVRASVRTVECAATAGCPLDLGTDDRSTP